MFKLEFDTENDAFCGDHGEGMRECSRILCEAAERFAVAAGNPDITCGIWPVKDANGNSVGWVRFELHPETTGGAE